MSVINKPIMLRKAPSGGARLPPSKYLIQSTIEKKSRLELLIMEHFELSGRKKRGIVVCFIGARLSL